MAHIEKSERIRAPIDYVFNAIVDPQRGGEWNPNILDVRNLSNRPVREGTTWQQTMVMMGRTATLTCRIVVLRPPHEGLLEISGHYHARVTTRCREVNGATDVTQVIDFQPPGGVLGKMAANLIRPSLERELAHAISRQKETLEREAGADGLGTA